LTTENFLIVDVYIISSSVRAETMSDSNNVLGSARVLDCPCLQVQSIIRNWIHLLS